jgi:hypothetical protein
MNREQNVEEIFENAKEPHPIRIIMILLDRAVTHPVKGGILPDRVKMLLEKIKTNPQICFVTGIG